MSYIIDLARMSVRRLKAKNHTFPLISPSPSSRTHRPGRPLNPPFLRTQNPSARNLTSILNYNKVLELEQGSIDLIQYSNPRGLYFLIQYIRRHTSHERYVCVCVCASIGLLSILFQFHPVVKYKRFLSLYSLSFSFFSFLRPLKTMLPFPFVKAFFYVLSWISVDKIILIIYIKYPSLLYTTFFKKIISFSVFSFQQI